MTQPTPGDVHVNTPLTNISIAFLQNARNFVSDRVFPNISVDKQSDVYYTYDRGFFNRDEMEQRAPGTESKGSGYELSTSPYYAPVYAFHHNIPDQRRANADSVLNEDRQATELVTHKALIKREKTWVTNFFTTGKWTTDITGVSSGPSGAQVLQWNDAASTPIEDIRAGMTTVLESTGFEPNVLVINQNVFNALIDHPDVIDRLKYGHRQTNSPVQADASDLAQLFKVDDVIVSKAIENTANEGAANAHSFIAGKAALLAYRPPSPGLMTPSAGYTFSWNGFLGAAPQGMRVKRFRLEAIASDRVEIEMAYVQQLISADLGYFFTSVVA